MDKLLNFKIMSDVIIKYCGPFTIQTSDATINANSVESVNVAIERVILKGQERPLEVEVKNK